MSRIEVVVPCYNYGRFLRQSVESVLAQSNADVRVLIVDDASEDETPRVCAELACEDPRVEVIRHPVNLGHIATYNEGIERARGDYLLLLSADDFLLPGALARAAAVLDADPDVGLAPGVCISLDPDAQLPAVSPEEMTLTRFPRWAAIERLAQGNFIGTATAVVRTSMQKALGGYLPELPHAGDLEMWLRFALAGRISFIRTPQAFYRRHESNMSKGYDARADFDQCAASFRLHMDAIRGLEPHGPSLAIQIDEIFADKAAALARSEGVRQPTPFSFFPVHPPPQIGVILGAQSGLEPMVAAVRQALPRAEVLTPQEGASSAALAAGSPFDYFLFLDGGASLSVPQVLALTRRLQAQPDRAHGVCGVRLELKEGAVTAGAPMVGLGRTVSFLTGVFAFSKDQAIAAQVLRRRLGPSDSADLAVGDAVLISCAGAKPPICHDIGPVTCFPSAEGKFGRDVLDRMIGLKAIATFKPMSARRGPGRRRLRTKAVAPRPSHQP